MARQKRSGASSPESVTRSPRSSRTRRSDVSGIEFNSEEEEEDYNEQANDDSAVKEESGEDEDEEEDIDGTSRNGSKRGRKRKAAEVEADDDDDEEAVVEEGEGEDEEDDLEEDVEEEEEDLDIDAVDEANEPQEGPVKKTLDLPRKPKKRGRKKLNITILEDGVYDDEGNPLNIDDDEVVIDAEDPKGLEKIDKDGNLKGGRRFRMKTFKLLGKGDKLYMISTEPARLVGFRDSYLLFKTHRSLFKKVCTNEEKFDLIDRGIIPNSYKGRSVNLVAARSIYREFGAKVVREGKKVIDDFWEQRAIDNGDIPGEYADPAELYRNNQAKLGSILGDSNTNGGSTPVASTPLVNYQTDPTWMFQVALKTRDYNAKLQDQRSQTFNRGIRDVFTNLNFFPASTQPTSTKIDFIEENKDGKLVFDAVFTNPNLKKRVTGLKNVPKEIFGDIEDEEVKKAIRAQQEYERSIV
ncbi:Polyadenylate-binding protein [Scheffersomyces xylosifermentans]|uniref:Polyadenylate-binding protein n=1 Tax=Scheffersomyces xylosifermentans TaxID=1304137 RepID=UPI00315C5C4D